MLAARQWRSGLCVQAAVRTVPSLEGKSPRPNPKQHLEPGMAMPLDAMAQQWTAGPPCTAQHSQRFASHAFPHSACKVQQEIFCPHRPGFLGPQDVFVDTQTATSPMTFDNHMCRGTDMTGWSRALPPQGDVSGSPRYGAPVTTGHDKQQVPSQAHGASDRLNMSSAQVLLLTISNMTPA